MISIDNFVQIDQVLNIYTHGLGSAINPLCPCKMLLETLESKTQRGDVHMQARARKHTNLENRSVV